MRRLQMGEMNWALSKLGNISIFHYLTDEERKHLLNISEIFEYNKDETIVTLGEISICFYAILSGTVNVTVPDINTGKEVFLSCIGEGEFFGEAGIFSNAKRTANVSAAETAEIISIGRNDFFSFISRHPSAGVKILMVFVNGLLKKLSESNKELAYERRNVLDQSAIDQFLQDMK
jgi:CRP/FNR family cyclic AMP-dependent transcriptional regulator